MDSTSPRLTSTLVENQATQCPQVEHQGLAAANFARAAVLQCTSVYTEKIGLKFHLKVQEVWRLLDEQNRKSTEVVCNYRVDAATELAAGQHASQAPVLS